MLVIQYSYKIFVTTRQYCRHQPGSTLDSPSSTTIYKDLPWSCSNGLFCNTTICGLNFCLSSPVSFLLGISRCNPSFINVCPAVGTLLSLLNSFQLLIVIYGIYFYIAVIKFELKQLKVKLLCPTCNNIHYLTYIYVIENCSKGKDEDKDRFICGSGCN